MTQIKISSYSDFVLPSNVATRADITRLVTELERVDNELTSISVRAGVGMTDQKVPVLSRKLTDFLVANKLTLNTGLERSTIIKQMHHLKDNVPVVHMTFAVEADAESLAELTQWLRTSIHPQAVIDVGLQPGLVAGVYLRTPNHIHDLSLRTALRRGRDLLAREIGAL